MTAVFWHILIHLIGPNLKCWHKHGFMVKTWLKPRPLGERTALRVLLSVMLPCWQRPCHQPKAPGRDFPMAEDPGYHSPWLNVPIKGLKEDSIRMPPGCISLSLWNTLLTSNMVKKNLVVYFCYLVWVLSISFNSSSLSSYHIFSQY